MNKYNYKFVEKISEVSNFEVVDILRLVIDIYPEKFIQRAIKNGAEEKTHILKKLKEMKEYQSLCVVSQPYIHFMMRNHLITAPHSKDLLYETMLSVEVNHVARRYSNFFRKTKFRLKKNKDYQFSFKFGKKELHKMLDLMEFDLKDSWFYNNLIECIRIQVRDYKEQLECKLNVRYNKYKFYSEACTNGKIYHLLQTILDIYWMQELLKGKEDLIDAVDLTEDKGWEEVILLFQYIYDFTSKRSNASYIRYKTWHEFLLSLEKVIYLKEYGNRILDDTLTDRLIPSQTVVGYFWLSEAVEKGDTSLQDIINQVFCAENVMV